MWLRAIPVPNRIGTVTYLNFVVSYDGQLFAHAVKVLSKVNRWLGAGDFRFLIADFGLEKTTRIFDTDFTDGHRLNFRVRKETARNLDAD
ncbi:MAG TPA: hypothetical protein VIJ25_04540 [Methylococcales bacterium]